MKISNIAVSLLFVSVDVDIVAMMPFAVTSAHRSGSARSHAVVIAVAMAPFAMLCSTGMGGHIRMWPYYYGGP